MDLIKILVDFESILRVWIAELWLKCYAWWDFPSYSLMHGICLVYCGIQKVEMRNVREKDKAFTW